MHNEAWTPETDAVVTRMRRDERLPAKVIAARVGRSPGAVSARLLKLGVTIHGRAEWGEGDVSRLRALVADPARTIRGIAREMGRTECSVRWKIDDLGIKPGRLRPWTASEDARALAASAGGEAARRSAAESLGRTYEAFQARLVHLGVRRKATWDAASEAELARLARSGSGVEAAAAALGRDPGAVRSKGYALGLRFRPAAGARLPWTDGEDSRLSEMAGRLGTGKRAVAAMAGELGRTERSVTLRLRHLGGGAGTRRRRPLDGPAREEILSAARSGVPLSRAILELGRDARTLKAVASSAGLGFARAPRQAPSPRPPRPASPRRGPMAPSPRPAGSRSGGRPRPGTPPTWRGPSRASWRSGG